jgi:ATP-dependent protease ClpP protease subunit
MKLSTYQLAIAGIVVGVAILLFGSLTFLRQEPQSIATIKEDKLYCQGSLSKTCTYYFSKSIKRAGHYRELITFLNQANSNDRVYLYFSGNGGLVSGAIALHYAIKHSKAMTTTRTVGDVYSAHALLAVSGKVVEVPNKLAVVMFHRSSLYSLEDYKNYCRKLYGQSTDRRVSMAQKCIAYVEMFNLQDRMLIEKVYKYILTKEELNKLKNGHDIIMTGEELEKRTNK